MEKHINCPLGLRIGESAQFHWVSDPEHKPDKPHHVGHFFHPDCGWAVLKERSENE